MSHYPKIRRTQKKTARKKRLLDLNPYRSSASPAGIPVSHCVT